MVGFTLLYQLEPRECLQRYATGQADESNSSAEGSLYSNDHNLCQADYKS